MLLRRPLDNIRACRKEYELKINHARQLRFEGEAQSDSCTVNMESPEVQGLSKSYTSNPTLSPTVYGTVAYMFKTSGPIDESKLINGTYMNS